MYHWSVADFSTDLKISTQEEHFQGIETVRPEKTFEGNSAQLL